MKQEIPGSETLKLGMEQEAKGGRKIYLYAASAVTVGTPYVYMTATTTDGYPEVQALTALTKNLIGKVVVATETTTAAGNSWFQSFGPVKNMVCAADTYVAGDMVKVYDGVTAPEGAAVVAPADFAVVAVVTSTTKIDAYLLDRWITASGA